MDVLLCGLMGYSVGCFNPAYLIGSRKGIDVRKEGSGNAGASNMVLLFGAKAGLITAILDILKAYFVTSLAACILPACAVAKEVAAAFCVLGHMFPATMKFKGGKGLACMVGGVLAYNKRLFIRLAILEIAAALILDYIIVITVSLACILPALYILSGGSLAVGVLFAAVGVVIINKHRANLERIVNGTEVRISYLWNREKETKRVKENMNEDGASAETE